MLCTELPALGPNYSRPAGDIEQRQQPERQLPPLPSSSRSPERSTRFVGASSPRVTLAELRAVVVGWP